MEGKYAYKIDLYRKPYLYDSLWPIWFVTWLTKHRNVNEEKLYSTKKFVVDFHDKCPSQNYIIFEFC